jgi:phosphoribosylformimino-5-aminoimidazole carboxamide ribotide isomerase
MTFEVIPSIDLKDGRCVRLYQGDYLKETVFSDDPVAMAEKWASLKPPRLHIIDLDGAATGNLRHLPVITTMASKLKSRKIELQVGGGIRSMEAIKTLLEEVGVQRVILGTAAIEDPDLVKKACQDYGESIIVGVDARAFQTDSSTGSPMSGHVAVHGWRNDTPKLALDLVNEMKGLGVKRFIYTDILRDGTLTRPNFDAIAELIDQTGATIIASGGITRLKDLEKLNDIGAEGAIIGRALYAGDIDLEKAIAAFRKDGESC